MRGPPVEQKESPESLAEEFGAEGIEALPRRVDRYGRAKSRALDVAHHIQGVSEGQEKLLLRLSNCGEYLAFRHYYTIDVVRLHGASFCMKHLLCPLCAVRRGAKALKAYLDRWQVIQADSPSLRPFLVTLTVKDGEDLRERFTHLHRSQRELWMRKHRGRGSVLDPVVGAVWSYEVKRGSGSGQWHPHLHMIALAECSPDQDRLSREWREVTGDSHIVDVRPINQEDTASGFVEVFKYAVKFSDMEVSDTWHAYQVMKNRRLIASAGRFRGVDVPEDLTDEPLDGLPFVSLFYRFFPGAGYRLSPSHRAL
jgi:Replication protein